MFIIYVGTRRRQVVVENTAVVRLAPLTSKIVTIDFFADAGTAGSPVDDTKEGVVQPEDDSEVEVHHPPWPSDILKDKMRISSTNFCLKILNVRISRHDFLFLAEMFQTLLFFF
jgi:hypothetical protein